MDTVGIVYNTDIYTRLTSELTSKLGHIRTQQLLSTISDIHYEDCISQWWTSPATPYTNNTNNSKNVTSNTNTSSRCNTNTSTDTNKSSNTTTSYTNTNSNSYISTSSYISIFDSQQEQQARIHEFISFIRYCTNNTPTTAPTDNYNTKNNNNNNPNYTNNTPIIIGHSLFFKQFYSTRLYELLKHTRPELYNMLYNKQYKLTNCSVLVLSILFSHDNDEECVILDAEVLYGGGFELNGSSGIGGMGGGGGGGRKRQERLSITSVGSRSGLSGEKGKSSGGDGSGWAEGAGLGTGESHNAASTTTETSSKKGGGGGLWDSLWG